MTVQIGDIKYIPGMYEKKRPAGSQPADKFFRDLEKTRLGQAQPPFSRGSE